MRPISPRTTVHPRQPVLANVRPLPGGGVNKLVGLDTTGIARPDHPDCWATEFPDGRYLLGNHDGDVSGRLKDLTFLLDETERLNAGDSFFMGRLDLNRIGVYGLSYGGMVSETCRRDARVRCAVFWDPTSLAINGTGLPKPFLTALGDSNFFESENQAFFAKATTNAYYLKIRNAQHLTATDFAWTTLTPSARDPALAINACSVWFFATYLKGETPPFPGNPEIHDVQKK